MQSTTKHPNISYRPDIQGLRAVAIALVVLAHANVPGFAGGFVGVDVFFVLSGYLITGLLVREHIADGGIQYVRFIARRLKRLLPALLMMLVIVIVAASFLLSAYETRMQGGSFIFSATWTSNLFFAFVDRDYFAALQARDLFLHTWSLGIEEQFYLVWPWLVTGAFLLITSKVGAHRRRGLLLAVLAVVFTASLLLCLYWSRTEPLLSFYMMPARGWQFALGAAVFVGFHDLGNDQKVAVRGKRSQISDVAVGIIGILLILGSAVLLEPGDAYPGYFALFPSFGAAMAIVAGTRPGNPLSRVLAHRYLVWLGDRSYSLYLWHWPVLVLGHSFGMTNTPTGIASLVGVSLVFAILSFRFVELPFWKGQFSFAPHRRAIVASALAVLVVIGVSEGLRHNVYGDAGQTVLADGYDPRKDVLLDVYGPGRFCDTWYSDASVIPCGIGARDGDSLAVVIGDSIGAQWSSLVSGIFAAPDWQVIVLTKSACAIVDESYDYQRFDAEYEICTKWRNSAVDYIGELKPDVVVVGSSAQYEFSESQWVNGTARVLARLTDAANKVIVIPGTPMLSFDGPSCLEEPYKFSLRLSDSMRECEEAQHASPHTEVAEKLERAAARFPRASVLDLGDLVCLDQRCAARTEDGVVVFRDSQHLTKSFVDSLIPAARERLVNLGVINDVDFSSLPSVAKN
jgi:peptidoglycan/LPS O-acetylase OafA/YrhL